MAPDQGWRSIKEVIQHVSQEQRPSAGIQRLLSGVVALTSAAAGRLYLLSLHDSCFQPEFETGTYDADVRKKVTFADLEGDTVTSPVIAALRDTKTMLITLPDRHRLDHISRNSTSVLLVPLLRNGSCLGLLVLEASNANQFTDKDAHTADTAVAIVIMLLEKRSTLELLEAVQKPINFVDQTVDRFLDDLLLLVWDASGMKYVALRELQPDNQSLRCLYALGFTESDNSLFDLYPLDAFSSFYQAVTEGKTVAEPNIAAAHLENLRTRAELGPIKSFVVAPIKVGTKIFGTLSFAAECKYNFSPLEIAGFETIANAIGIAISNYRNAERAHEIFVENARVAISFTALEVAQSARHEARGSLDNAQLLLTRLLTKLQSIKEDRDPITQLINDLGRSLKEVVRAIDKIRDASLIPEMKLITLSIRQLWQEAIVTVGGKISSENVRHEISGDAEISVYPGALRLAFLNLLLNSLDAFHDWGKKSGRKITITIDPRAEDAQQVRIRYHDNASGIDPTRLKLPPELIHKGRQPKDLIFELGVTSKESGSGYGLYLVRRILDSHKGSIDLIDHRGGVTFDITLPKTQTIAAETAKI